MKRLAWFVSIALLAGCGKALDDPVKPDQARAALQNALEAWQQGEPYGALPERKPPVHFNEPEWRAGKKLVSFDIGKVELLGRQGRGSVKLVLRDAAGKDNERTISYLIDTTPQVVITREGLGL
jgi:hypothetical protein